jgi:hypothetical protein
MLHDHLAKLRAGLALRHFRTKPEYNFASLDAAIVVIDAQASFPFLESLSALVDLPVLVMLAHDFTILSPASTKTWCVDMLPNKAVDV